MNPLPEHELSFVCPVYNEEQTIEKTIRSYASEFSGKIDFEMIVTEDGSTDKTKSILKDLEAEGTLPLKIYLHTDRKGYLGAIRGALSYPKSTWIFLVDSDYQFDPHDFWKLWAHKDAYDIVLGLKTNRKDGLLRVFLSRGYNLLLRIFFGVPYMDMDTGFRLFKRSSIAPLVPTIANLGFFTAELVIKAHDHGYKILEVPVSHFKQEARASNIFHLNKLPSIIATELKGMFRLFMEIRVRNKKPV